MQGTRVRSLIQKDPTWSNKAHALKLLKPVCLEPVFPVREAIAVRSPCTAMKSSPLLLQLEKACSQQQRPSTAKNK